MKTLVVAAALTSAVAVPASAGSIASVSINGSNFLQSGSVLNNATSTAQITKVIYSLGTPGDGIATWDSNTGGGIASDPLSNPGFFQTVTWEGLSIAPGATFNFGGLDIDLIVTLDPLSVTGSPLDLTGTSLVNAFFSVFWSDGSSATSELVETGWTVNQNLSLSSQTQIPEPTALGLLGLGVLGLVAARRWKAA